MVYFSGTVFDAVWNKKRSGKIEQAMINLDACKDDIDLFRDVLKRYKVKKENEHNCHNPTRKQMDDLIKELAKKFKSEPEKNFLVIYVVAGHGMNCSG